MKGLKLDFKKIGLTTAGNAVGLVTVGQINKLGFIKKIEKPVIKGLITLGVGRILMPFLATQMGMAKKGMNDVLYGASEAISTYGVIQIASSYEATKAADKRLFPSISGIEGYEESPYVRGLGLVAEEEVSGYSDGEQTDNVSGNNDDVYEN